MTDKKFSAVIFKRWVMRTVAVPKSTLPAHADQASVPIIATIHTGERERWESTLSPQDAAHWALVIPQAMLAARGLAVDDSVSLSVAHDTDRSAPVLPEYLDAALAARPGARANFRAMTVSWQRQMVRYVDKGKSPDTREKYIEILIERVNEAQAKREANKPTPRVIKASAKTKK
jgi:Bacteriocin-protection, YdeI or OmpD-Associated